MKVSRKKSKESSTTFIIINIEKKDYEKNVENALNNYRKSINIPGFRKGFVPTSLIKKKYEIPTIAEEVNKLLQQELIDPMFLQLVAILQIPHLQGNTQLNLYSK